MAASRKSPSKKTGSKRRATASAPKSARAKARPAAKAKSASRSAAKPATKAKSAARAASATKRATKSAAKPKRQAAPRPAAAPLYRTLTPFLSIGGAEEALDFYKKAFGAQERARMPGPDGKIMHAEITIGDSVLMLSDAIRQPPSQSTLHLYVDDCDAVYERALQAGATEKMPMQDMFWGDRYGMVTDPFGNDWSIATHKEDVAPEEMARRMEAATPPSLPPSDLSS